MNKQAFYPCQTLQMIEWTMFRPAAFYWPPSAGTFCRENDMVKARIHRGRVELQDPIPEAWDGPR
jgi:hypothetical protein